MGLLGRVDVKTGLDNHKTLCFFWLAWSWSCFLVLLGLGREKGNAVSPSLPSTSATTNTLVTYSVFTVHAALNALPSPPYRYRTPFTYSYVGRDHLFWGDICLNSCSFIDSISLSGQARHGHSCKAQLMPRLGTVTRADSAAPLLCMLWLCYLLLEEGTRKRKNEWKIVLFLGTFEG